MRKEIKLNDSYVNVSRTVTKKQFAMYRALEVMDASTVKAAAKAYADFLLYTFRWSLSPGLAIDFLRDVWKYGWKEVFAEQVRLAAEDSLREMKEDGQ